MSGLVDAAREVKDEGTFGYVERSLATPDLAALHAGVSGASSISATCSRSSRMRSCQ